MSEQDLTPDQLEQLREQLASVSAADVVAEAALSLIALAYVRLILPSQHERFRDLDAARLLVDTLGGMLAASRAASAPPSRACARPYNFRMAYAGVAADSKAPPPRRPSPRPTTPGS